MEKFWWICWAEKTGAEGQDDGTGDEDMVK